MLQLLNISNIALIDELQVEFDNGLNLLTGETGSGKSIIVDALGVLIGGRFSVDLLKSGTERGFIEGLFLVNSNSTLEQLLTSAGLATSQDKPTQKANDELELIIRREVSVAGRNKIFVNNQLATQALLRELREFLVDIHGQGDQQTLFNTNTHLDLLDSFGGHSRLRDEVANAYQRLRGVQTKLETLKADEAEKFQLVDTLKFQIAELERSQLVVCEDNELEDGRRRLANVEKLTSLCHSSYGRIYEDEASALARLRLAMSELTELAEYESRFGEYLDGLESARALLEDLSFSLRDFADKLEFSPARLAAIEDRLAELSRLKRKYGGSIEAALEHLARSQDRLGQIESSEEIEKQLKTELTIVRDHYLERAGKLHKERARAAKKFEQAIEKEFREVAMENARFQVLVSDKLQFVDGSGKGAPIHESTVHPDNDKLKHIGQTGADLVEFYFSANPGEELKPLARVASGGEASRLMLVLKTVANAAEFPRTIVFDEIDAGIGGRVSEAVGVKLRKLAQTNQVLCVTHQPQIARFANKHLTVQKETLKNRTRVSVTELDRQGRIEELARMLTGAEITDSARRHAEEMLER
ncbi:MAG TPA: DNA repair protein RecN [Pyrinomonadaceae bacterium]|nr:DNA repair protein RecN [Pyrinomonadaceae bacterium]